MKNQPDIFITGIGVTTAFGAGKASFEQALFGSEHRFRALSRPGRQHGSTGFIGAEIDAVAATDRVDAKLLRTASLTSQVALTTLAEAWEDAGLDGADGRRIGLIVGGNNLQQRENLLLQERHAEDPLFLRPSYAMSFMDTDVCGLCSQAFGIQGMAHTCGGASAGGQLAIIEAAEAIMAGRVDICIAMGPLMDLSHWELRALQTAGAMVPEDISRKPTQAYRPFDEGHAGFVYGEACGVLVLERAGTRTWPRHAPYGALAGWGLHMDGHRNPDPSPEGESKAIQAALARAGLEAGDIDYVNPHGTGSLLGDRTELAALRLSGLQHAAINTTKSITGHGLSAAGAVEAVATLIQMKRGELHPSRNLVRPIEADFEWVGTLPIVQDVRSAVSLSMGFGGMNTAICLTR